MNAIDKKLHKCLNRILEADIDEKTIEHFLTVVNKIENKTQNLTKNSQIIGKWADITLLKYKLGKPSLKNVKFILNVVGIISTKPVTFVMLHNYNIYNRLIGLVTCLNTGEDESFNIAYIKLLYSLTQTNFGMEWLIGCNQWTTVVDIHHRHYTERLAKEVIKVYGAMFIKAAPSNKVFLVDLYNIALTPMRNIMSTPIQSLTDEIEHQWYLALRPTIRGYYDCLVYLSENITIQTFRYWTMYFLKLFNMQTILCTLLGKVRSPIFTLDISKGLLLTQILEVKEVSESSKADLVEKYIKSLVKILEVNIDRGFHSNVLELGYIGQTFWRRICDLLKITTDKLPFDFQHDLLIFQMMSLMSSNKRIVGRTSAFGDDFRDDFIDLLSSKSNKNTWPLMMKFLKTLNAKDSLISECIEALVHISKKHDMYNKDNISIFFRYLIYYLADIVNQISKSNTLTTNMYNEKLIDVVLQAILIYIEQYDVSWKTSVESIFILNTIIEFLQIHQFNVELIVKALKLVELAISKYMSPNLALLLDSNDPTMISLGPLLHSKLHDSCVLIRHTAMEVLLKISQYAVSKFPYYRKIILESKLCDIAVKIARSTEESSVRIKALKCLQKMILVNEFWERLVSIVNFQEVFLCMLTHEENDCIRSELVNVLTILFEEEHLSDSQVEKLYNNMAHLGIYDHQIDVRVNVLNFWHRVIKMCLHEEGMIDNEFPEVTFSKMTRKIVILDEKQIFKRLNNILNKLSSIGCLSVLNEARKGDEALEKNRAIKIIKELSDILVNYKFDENSLDGPSSKNATIKCNHINLDLQLYSPEDHISEQFLDLFTDGTKVAAYYESVSPMEFLQTIKEVNTPVVVQQSTTTNEEFEFDVILDSIVNDFMIL